MLRRHVFGTSGGRNANTQYLMSFSAGEPVLGSIQADTICTTFGFWGRRQFPIGTGIEAERGLSPRYVFALRQNYPNPFNPITTISYEVGEGKPVTVEIHIYDVRGTLVKTLVNEIKQPGHYLVVWNGRNDVGQQVSTGIYFYQFRAGHFAQTKKLLLLK
ncbi:MAG: T9SS type A sorting domain-containing protein [Dehalococcoidia bacterium]|nr:MAG: T9SS type A sorting domain-containing protein [Dehalococcoidia bacterium]